MITRSCECEHLSHDPESFGTSGQRTMTPNGNPGHDYGAKFSIGYLSAIKTDYGTFVVCVDCSNDCLHDYKKE